MKKLNNLFSTVTTVMIASSIALVPMTLRGEETEDKNQITYEELIKKSKESTEELRKAGEKNMKEGLEGIKKADEKIEKADAEIERSKKEIEDAKKKIEEADKKIEEAKKLCLNLNNWLIKAEEYCSKNKCSEEDNKIVNEKKKEYQENCSELMPPATETKKEQK
jgi:septal ring factor EnvC (AmiA/AmiB activator)